MLRVAAIDPSDAARAPRADRETSARADDHRALRLWLRLLTCTQLLERHMRNLLRLRFGTTLPRFDLMSRLERYPEGLKMKELSHHLMVTGGKLLHLERSEEHTSELQSHHDIVCRLLLEKKKHFIDGRYCLVDIVIHQ